MIIKKSIFLVAIVLLFFTPAFAQVQVNKPAPEFTGINLSGETVSLSSFSGKIVVLEWFNKSCPFVKKHYQRGAMQALQAKYVEKGVVWLTIDSTHVNHSSVLSEGERLLIRSDLGMKNSEFIIDNSGTIGKLYGAKVTPHMFVIDKNQNIAYQGAIDDNPYTFSDPKEAKNYVAAALDELLAGKPVSVSETKQYGCAVKYAE